MSSSFSLYIKTIGLSGVSKITKLICVFIGLWLINAILEKGEFGLFMIALTFYFFLSAVITTGFKNLVLYRVSQMEKDDINARAFGGGLLVLGFVASAILAILAITFSDFIAQHLFNKPDLKFWLMALAFYMPFDMSLQIMCFWHRARQDTPISIVFLDLFPPLIRLGVLMLAFCLGWSKAGIVSAYLAEVVITSCILFAYRPMPLSFKRKVFMREDRNYGLKMSLTQLLHQPSRSLDVLLVGALTTEIVAAEYVLASRFLSILLLGKQFVEPLVTPRIGALLKLEDNKNLKQEFEMTRVFSLVLSLCALLFFVVFGKAIFGIFGDFENSYTYFLILSAAVLLRVGTGFNAAILNMSGHAGYTLFTIAMAALIFIIPGPPMIIAFGAIGAALAVLLADIVSNTLVLYFDWKLLKFKCLNMKDGLILMITSALIVCTAFNLISSIILACYLSGLLCFLFWLYFGHLKSIISQFRTSKT